MAIYNVLRTSVRCPRCGTACQMEVNLYFGFCDLLEYRLGDRYVWRARKVPKNGGRPEGGNCDGEGYAVCPSCAKDFFCVVKVRADLLSGVEPDPTRKGCIPPS